MVKATPILIFAALFVQTTKPQSCKTATFTNVKIKASKYSIHQTLQDDNLLDIELESSFTGCITPMINQLKDAMQIQVTKQQVPVILEGAVQDLPLLEFLRLEENGIQEIKPGALKNLPAIDVISVRSNELKTIPEGVFSHLNVRALHLSNNSISLIHAAAFNDMPKLNVIYLERNRLREWNSDWFFNSPNVVHLSVNWNEITALPEKALKNLKSVSRVDFYHNKIGEIHVGAFKGLNQLGCLDFERNNINSFSERIFKDLAGVQSLMLSYNRIRCVSDKFLNTLNSTSIFRISSNPLKCKCLNTIYNWAIEKKVRIKISNRCLG